MGFLEFLAKLVGIAIGIVYFVEKCLSISDSWKKSKKDSSAKPTKQTDESSYDCDEHS